MDSSISKTVIPSLSTFTSSSTSSTPGLSETNRAELLGHSVEVNLHNYSFADHNYCKLAREALDSPLVTPGDTQNIIEFKTKNLRDAY